LVTAGCSVFVRKMGVSMSSKNSRELCDFILPRYHVATKSYVHSRSVWVIEIDVPALNFTKRQCEKIIEKFRDIAGRGGVVSIRRPCDYIQGTMLPWAIDRMDGRGVHYNDFLFD
jgi:hypothetical protein